MESWDDDVAMVEAVLADFGRVDILVHNGGIASRGNTVAKTEPDEMERVVRTHAFGPFYLSKLLVPQMRELGRGDIIFISSVATDHHAANGSPYNMGKAAAEALAMTLGAEEQKHGIRVNIVAPGLVTTDMGDRLTKAMTRGAAESRGRPRCVVSVRAGRPTRRRRRGGGVLRVRRGLVPQPATRHRPRRRPARHRVTDGARHFPLRVRSTPGRPSRGRCREGRRSLGR